MLSILPTALATFTRKTAYVVDARSPAASFTPDRQPSQTAQLLVVVTGSPSGTVVITGTVSGVSDTETLTWSGTTGKRLTVKRWSAVTSFTSTLTGGTTLTVQATGAGGAPLAEAETVLRSRWPVAVQRTRQQTWPAGQAGHDPQGDVDVLVPYEETWTPRAGDLCELTTGETFEVVSVELRSGGLMPGGWKLSARRQQGR